MACKEPSDAANERLGNIHALKSSILDLLHGRLSNESLLKYEANIAELRQCSFYIEIINQDMPNQGINNSATMFDQVRFHRMKKMANGQVKIKLFLLEELYKQIRSGKDELENIAKTPNFLAFNQEHIVYIQECLSRVTKALDDLNAVMAPGHLYMKHYLIPQMRNSRMPRMQLNFVVKMPVFFNRFTCKAHGTLVQLYWWTENHQVNERFEVRYRVLEPTIAEEQRKSGIFSTFSCSMLIRHLLPGKRYEFAVKRSDCYTLVYSCWNDTIVLCTTYDQ